MLTVRLATPADLPACLNIYAHHVLSGSASFEEVPPDQTEFNARYAAVTGASLPYLVAVAEEQIVGYAYASRYRPRSAYRYTVENSVYVAANHVGQGVGCTLLAELIKHCEQGPWRQMIAVIGDSANAASIALHTAAGFRHVGVLEAVGFKFGRWVDSVLMQRALGPGDTAPPN